MWNQFYLRDKKITSILNEVCVNVELDLRYDYLEKQNCLALLSRSKQVVISIVNKFTIIDFVCHKQMNVVNRHL